MTDTIKNNLPFQKYCQTFGGNLASVHSKSENDLLLNLVPGSTQTFIGGHDAVKVSGYADNKTFVLFKQFIFCGNNLTDRQLSPVPH